MRYINESTVIAAVLTGLAAVALAVGAQWAFPAALVSFAALFGLQGLSRPKVRSTIERARHVTASTSPAESLIPGVAEILDYEGVADMARPVVDPSAVILGRVAIGPTGWRANGAPDADDLTSVHREVSPVDILVVASTGLHLLNVIEPSQPWNRKYARKMSDAEFGDFIDQSLAETGLFGRAETLFDRLVDEHGYQAVAEADPRNLIIDRSSIRRAWVKRPFRLLIDLGMPVLHMETIDGVLTRWQLKDGRPQRLTGLDQSLAKIGLGSN